jgi:hypothetical protein
MVACLFEWSGVSLKQFHQLLAELSWTEKLSDGTALYDAVNPQRRLLVINVWDSVDALELFLRTQLSRSLTRVGLSRPMMKAWSLSGAPEQASRVNNQMLIDILSRSLYATAEN